MEFTLIPKQIYLIWQIFCFFLQIVSNSPISTQILIALWQFEEFALKFRLIFEKTGEIFVI